MNVLSKVPQFWKALIAFAAPGASVLAMAVLPGGDGGSHITQAEWVTALVAAVITSAGVALKSNAPKPPAGP